MHPPCTCMYLHVRIHLACTTLGERVAAAVHPAGAWEGGEGGRKRTSMHASNWHAMLPLPCPPLLPCQWSSYAAARFLTLPCNTFALGVQQAAAHALQRSTALTGHVYVLPPTCTVPSPAVVSGISSTWILTSEPCHVASLLVSSHAWAIPITWSLCV
jgi:hypothetical protein